jgi:aldose 1-epimerase
MLELQNHDVTLQLTPNSGGILRFCWRDMDVFRRAKEDCAPVDLACFPMLPFAGRIDHGRFSAGGKDIHLAPSNPAADVVHALHGYGWVNRWQVVYSSMSAAKMRFCYQPGDWPWPFLAEQEFCLLADGYSHLLTLRNDGDTPMPAGMGIHPFFPLADAKLQLDAKRMWTNDADMMPAQCVEVHPSRQWLGNTPLDNCTTGIAGPIQLAWPSHSLRVEPDSAFTFAHIYAPEGQNFFCVEPVSHMPNALNRGESRAETGVRWLSPGEIWATKTHFIVS